MPLLVAALIRVVIQAIISTAVFMGLDWLLAPLTDKAKAAVAKAYGMTPEEAEDTIANEMIDALTMVGILSITIKSKLPTVVAEKLGFTSRGFLKRPKSPKLPTSDVGSTAAAISVTTVKATITVPEATAAISTARATIKGASKAFDFLSGKLNSVFLGFLVVGGFIDFGNWETGAYSNFFQKLFATITFGILVPNEDWRKTKTASPEVFDKVYNTYKTAGAIGINDPFKLQSVPFSRDNLIDLVDKVGATLLLSTGTASTKDVLLGTQLNIVFDQASVNAAGVAVSSSVPSPTTPTTTNPPINRVFTGIVSQGVVGKGLVFTPRPDDIIESVEELKQAAANNLTPYLNALLGKIVYEVKVVSSIITKEGFKQSGTTQQIQNGAYSNGTPKYKTVTNKFATLTVYALTDKGSRAKLTTIVLGPTNSAKLRVATDDLRVVESELPGLVTTTDINAITGIETAATVTVSTPAASGGASIPAPVTGSSATSATPVSTQAPVMNIAGNNALTLFDWYQAQGQKLPNVATRSELYAELGLGQASYYTGTAEQNTKLLNALKLKDLNTYLAAVQQALESRQSAENSSGSGSSSNSKSSTTSKTDNKTSSTKDTKPITVLRIYTTAAGERVTKYSDGSEKRVKI